MGALLSIPLNLPDHFLMHCHSPCFQTACGQDSCECDVKINDSDSDSNLSVGSPHA